VDRVEKGLGEVERRRHVVSETRSSKELSRTFTRLPNTDEADEEVLRKATIEHLAEEENVRGEGRLQHDGHVRGVEETDGKGTAHTALTRRLDGDFHAEALQIDDGGKYNTGGQEVRDVGQALTVEGFAEGELLVGPGEEEVEESDDCALEFRTATGIDGGRREGLPHDRLTDVGSDEKRNTRTETVALLKELVEQDNDCTMLVSFVFPKMFVDGFCAHTDTSNNQLDD